MAAVGEGKHQEPTRERVSREALLPSELRHEILRDVFPEAFADGVLQTDVLGKLLGLSGGSDGKERYSLGWTGKADAVRIVTAPTTATLVPDEAGSVDFEETENVVIEGENLEALKLLYKAYFGRVRVIYIDPPYNTGKDFVYSDDYRQGTEQYLRATNQKNELGNLLTSNPETSGRFHSAWLSMMYPRLWLARQLLSEDGVLFVSIDDHEVHNLRLLLNEVFGEENFIAQVAVETNPKGRVLREHFARNHDYLLVYSRSALDVDLSIGLTDEEVEQRFDEVDEKGHRFRHLELRNTHRQFGRFNRPNLYFPLYVSRKGDVALAKSRSNSIEVLPHWNDGFKGCWTWDRAHVARDLKLLDAREVNGRWTVFRKAYYESPDGQALRRKLKTMWMERQFHTEIGQQVLDELIPGRVMESPKPPALIRTALQLVNDPDAVVLDFFAGSGTTAQAVLEQNRADGGNRRFVLVQLPDPTPEGSNARKKRLNTIAEICAERVRRFIKRTKKSQPELELVKRDLPEDLGFRLLKMTASNFARWKPKASGDEGEFDRQLELLAEGLVPGWKKNAVLWEVVLKEGFSLGSRLERLSAGGVDLVKVTDVAQEQSMLVCLDDDIPVKQLKDLNLDRETVLVCRDSALDDTAAANLALHFRLRTV